MSTVWAGAKKPGQSKYGEYQLSETSAPQADHGPAPVETFDAEAVNSKESRQLYVARKKVFPKRASGSFRQLKWWIMAVTLGIYYITPWLRWDRGPFAPDQAVLVDLANRRFYFFFIEIWPQEFYYVAGLLVMAGVGLFLVTSTVGRAWCGYTCPQTVWVDLFLVVERFFEGDRNARIKLDKAPWSGDKLTKRLLKHASWLVIAVATGGAWIFYFADAPTLFMDIFTGEAAYVAYATVAVLTLTTYTFGGFMREQVCTYMCPWPRIQAAMLDEDSLTVTYNDWRGEPRSRHVKQSETSAGNVGDCVDCNACVAVCPMGIDIRDGQQMECITCALCIDACDGVMEKVGREKGLISYATLRDYNANKALEQHRDNGVLANAVAHTTWRSIVRPRTIMYTAVWGLMGLALLGLLLTRDRLEVNVLHDRNPVYVRLSDGAVRNGYEIKILNMVAQPRTFSVKLDGLPGATMTVAGSDQEPGRRFEIAVPSDRLLSSKIFVHVPRARLVPGKTDFDFVVSDVNGAETARYDARFEAPAEGER